ncbi:bifunctional [glutamine synthetase] adenylyltransferase/[glutamine synthetase]-adenylyl-L-tyrosine phosphorylase [Mesorhizobium sp. RP14(2022)]|uniref:Bifunctional glutamine synthetase adenylyltransferase/adenylyl-removing enzyme n=1 Tax=Mesorhizobium liriopis TaxID=2953882 RepID=A0ABT1C1X2_9HYPH|nr:bifunctional [glutamine synthetase] adenylyltransferase/[glutamine synthetase]-adenylyl-L-tyrosine phosphorylase [Mesorhizobium liriopis]
MSGDGGEARPRVELKPLDRSNADRLLRELVEAAEAKEAVVAAMLGKRPDLARWLAAVFDLSPHLFNTARKQPAVLRAWLDGTADARLDQLENLALQVAFQPDASEASVMRELRQLKAESQFLVALRDLSGEADAEETVRRLSLFAEAAVSGAVDFLLRDAHRQNKLKLPDPDKPSEGSGLIVLGMGKLGGHELNFSSDIDLIVFFEPHAPAVPDPYEAADVFARITRRLVRILQDRTEHGYVFRTDLRLRPDPGSTPLAIPVEAALIYYEGRGQNWERAAMIKARPVAGDRAAGQRFLNELRPYVWRKHLDYAAIADVHSIKRQIHAHRGLGAIAVEGHNVKLGRGGIREIEFFVQTQQLIAGGRFPELRGKQTVPMLHELAARGWITPGAAEALAHDYWFLRRVEHAIQMVADEQSHSLPEDDAGVERIAHMLGFGSRDTFAERFQRTLGEVEHHYAELFETAPELSSGIGNLVFTGEGDDPDTLQTLSSLGFKRPGDIARIVRTWHFGRYKAVQSAEARERLTELTPALLRAFGATGRADETAVAFDAFLAGLPAGIQLFSLLQSNQSLLQLLVTTLSAAPRLAGIITRRPHVFDAMLDPALLNELPDRAYLAERLDAFMSGVRSHEEKLDRLRIFTAEQKFLIGMRLLAGVIDARRAGEHFSDLADLVIAFALDAVTDEFALRHGCVARGRVALLGMGKLGSRELTAGSDIDLILLYDHDHEALESDGAKGLAPAHYYARLTQRLIAALSAPTAEGVLYEIDLRLRPSGNKGPVAVPIDAFSRYQRSEAWTWEHMALTRARPVAGDASLCAQLDAEVVAIVASPRDTKKVRKDAAEMRRILLEEKPPRDLWDIKLAAGGLVDLEFIAQVGKLVGEATGEGRVSSTGLALSRLSPEFAPVDVREQLAEAFAFYNTLSQLTRLCLTEPLDPKDVPVGLMERLLGATHSPDRNHLEARLKETQQAVARHFRALIG